MEKNNSSSKSQEEDLSNFIVVTSVHDNDSISSPLDIKGKARGNWFFEANSPVILLDNSGNILARSY